MIPYLWEWMTKAETASWLCIWINWMSQFISWSGLKLEEFETDEAKILHAHERLKVQRKVHDHTVWEMLGVFNHVRVEFSESAVKH